MKCTLRWEGRRGQVGDGAFVDCVRALPEHADEVDDSPCHDHSRAVELHAPVHPYRYVQPAAGDVDGVVGGSGLSSAVPQGDDRGAGSGAAGACLADAAWTRRAR